MKKLKDGMLLYHGSYCKVETIDLERCAPGRDFGQGFYVTSDRQQAYDYVRLSVNKARNAGVVPETFSVEDGFVNVYRLHLNPSLFTLYFTKADTNWLHFVAAHRKKTIFPALRSKYAAVDIIGGKIADDRTAEALNNYVNGVFGEPGDPAADRIAIRRLIPNQLTDQFCFRTPDGIAALEYVRSERIGDIQIDS